MRRASHCHQVPQTGRAQIGPVIEDQRGEQHPDLGGGVGEQVPAPGSGPQVGDRPDEDDREGEVADPCGGDVEVEDPLEGPAHVVGRLPGDEQGQEDRHGHQGRGPQAEAV